MARLQEREDLVDGPERDQVAQLLADREEPHDLALVLGRVVAVELVDLEPCALELRVVDEDRTDPRERKVARELRFPHALGEPEAVDLGAEELREPRTMQLHLVDAVAARDRGQDRLVEAGGLQLDLAALDAGAHELDQVLRVLHPPLEQRSGDVQHVRDARMAGERLEQRPVGAGRRLLDHPAEVADRLVAVEVEDEAQWSRRSRRRTHRRRRNRRGTHRRAGHGQTYHRDARNSCSGTRTRASLPPGQCSTSPSAVSSSTRKRSGMPGAAVRSSSATSKRSHGSFCASTSSTLSNPRGLGSAKKRRPFAIGCAGASHSTPRWSTIGRSPVPSSKPKRSRRATRRARAIAPPLPCRSNQPADCHWKRSSERPRGWIGSSGSRAGRASSRRASGAGSGGASRPAARKTTRRWAWKSSSKTSRCAVGWSSPNHQYQSLASSARSEEATPFGPSSSTSFLFGKSERACASSRQPSSFSR